MGFDGRLIRLSPREFCAIPATKAPARRESLSTTMCSSGSEWFAAGEAAKFAGGCNAVASEASSKEFAMLTLHNSKPIISRVAASLKFAVLLVLLGLIVVATERPTLLSPAGAVTMVDDAAYVAAQAKAPAPRAAAAPAVDEFTYFPSQFAAPTGPVEDLPPQF
jgi:hypothetical protein